MKRKIASTKSKTDWAPFDSMTGKDIDYSVAPPITPEMFAQAIVRKGFKSVVRKKQGSGYQTQINELLRAYVTERTAKHNG